jgi:hypothetical protein
MTRREDRWIRHTTIACVGMLALIAGTVSDPHMHLLVELHGQPSCVATLTRLPVDGMVIAASTTLLADSGCGGRGGFLPWALLVAGSLASLAANVAVVEPSLTGRVIAAWPSFSLIASYELLMRHVRRAAEMGTVAQRSPKATGSVASTTQAALSGRAARDAASDRPVTGNHTAAGREIRLDAWRRARNNRRRRILAHWKGHSQPLRPSRAARRLVKRSGLAGELGT